MKAWMTKALELLTASLEPPKHELNECDWKAALLPDKKRLTLRDAQKPKVTVLERGNVRLISIAMKSTSHSTRAL